MTYMWFQKCGWEISQTDSIVGKLENTPIGRLFVSIWEFNDLLRVINKMEGS